MARPAAKVEDDFRKERREWTEGEGAGEDGIWEMGKQSAKAR